MLSIHVKQIKMAAVPAILIATAAALAVFKSESYLPRVLIGYSAVAALLTLTVWAVTQTIAATARARAAEDAAARAQLAATATEAELAKLQARVSRTGKVKRQLERVEQRLSAVENDAMGRALARQLWTDEDWSELLNGDNPNE